VDIVQQGDEDLRGAFPVTFDLHARRQEERDVKTRRSCTGDHASDGIAEVERAGRDGRTIEQGPQPTDLGHQSVHEFIDLRRRQPAAMPAQPRYRRLDPEQRGPQLVVPLDQTGRHDGRSP
jgi:hypothetical protein